MYGLDAGWRGGNFFTRVLARMAAARHAADLGRDAVPRQAKNLCPYRSVHRGVALASSGFYLSEVGSTLRYEPNSGWVPQGEGSIAPTRDDYLA